MTKAAFQQAFASGLFGLAIALALMLSGFLLVNAISTRLLGFQLFSLWGFWTVLVLANPLLGGVLRVKFRGTFDGAGNRALLAMAMLSVVAVHTYLLSGII